jgi:hypothetical protein
MVKRLRTDTKTDWTTSITAKSELDNRADTCCASVNFRPLEFNGMSCSVTPFHTDYPSMEQIPVVTCATAVDMLDGSTIILIIHEALYFGAGMDHSLINPNQIRTTGIPVNDNPFDKSRPFGIDHPEAYIPFSTEGATVYFRSRSPTDEDLDHYKYLNKSHCRRSIVTNTVLRALNTDDYELIASEPSTLVPIPRIWIVHTELVISPCYRNILGKTSE